jgi:hypothetical protein
MGESDLLKQPLWVDSSRPPCGAQRGAHRSSNQQTHRSGPVPGPVPGPAQTAEPRTANLPASLPRPSEWPYPVLLSRTRTAAPQTGRPPSALTPPRQKTRTIAPKTAAAPTLHPLAWPVLSRYRSAAPRSRPIPRAAPAPPAFPVPPRFEPRNPSGVAPAAPRGRAFGPIPAGHPICQSSSQ